MRLHDMSGTEWSTSYESRDFVDDFEAAKIRFKDFRTNRTWFANHLDIMYHKL
jgi:hypothetical protein